MKNIFYLTLFILGLSLAGCQKYENGGRASSAIRNIVGTWKLNNYYISGISFTSNLQTTDYKGIVRPMGYFYSSYSISAPEHGGTHLDAPIHFAENKQTADTD
jgi:kynurenine formamidase